MPSILHDASKQSNIERSIDNWLLTVLSPVIDGVRIYLNDEHYPSKNEDLPDIHVVSTIHYTGSISEAYHEDDGGVSTIQQLILDLNIYQKEDSTNRESSRRYRIAEIATTIKEQLGLFSGIIIYDYSNSSIIPIGSLEPSGTPSFRRGGVYDGIRSALVSCNLNYEEEMYQV